MMTFEDAQVRFHGNGFLQAEDGAGGKYHMWHPDCPRQERKTFLHNHNHGFRSTILMGCLKNEEYRLEGYNRGPTHSREHPWKNGQWLKYQAVPREGKDTLLEPTWYWCKPKHTRMMMLNEGSTYDFPLDEYLYHESFPVTPVVITHVTRMEQGDWLPTVVAAPNIEPDNDFNRYGFPDEARDLYAELVATVRAFSLDDLEEGQHAGPIG